MENSQRREKGQGLVEYALILVLVAIVVIAILLLLGPTTGNVFSNVVAFFGSTNGGGGGANQIAWQADPQVTKTSGGLGNCSYAASSISLKVTQGGSPVSGVSLSGTVVIHDNDNHEILRFDISGTSGSGGVASLSGSWPGTSACGGQQATVYVSGVSPRTDTDLTN
jgi:pilus assembly protein Flp/PilA